MNKVAKIIRIITVAPIMALLLVVSIILKYDGVSFPNAFYFTMSIIFLCVIPCTSYLVERKLKIIKRIKPEYDMRKRERTLAIIFSCVSYSIYFMIVLLTDQTEIIKEMALTYLLSGYLVMIFSFVFKINASGHMCGSIGPITLLAYTISPWFLLMLVPISLVVWSSLKLRRHKVIELIIGAIIPVISFFISIVII